MGKGIESIGRRGIPHWSHAISLRAVASSFIIPLFFLSGASSLVYEVLWVRMFAQTFGNTTQAVSTVLTAFMAGLALGSYLFGRLVDRHGKWSLFLYGMLEGVIGLYALAVPILISQFESIHTWAYRVYQPSSWVFMTIRFALCVAILLVPTTMMGATLPVITRFVVRRKQNIGFRVGVLYGVNTAGAVVGCYLAGFIFIGSMGVTKTLHLAVAASGLIMIAALALSGCFLVWGGHERGLGELRFREEETGESEESWKKHVVLACFAVAGFTSLCYEVMWTRALVFFLGNSTYAFTSMLTTFLFGLALGSFLFARVADRSRDRYLLFGVIEATIAMWALVSVPLFSKLFYTLGQSWSGFNVDLTWRAVAGLKFFKAFLVMFVPTVLMGAAFPVVCRIYSSNIGRIGSDVASVYSLNTLGAIAGSALAGFVVIPALGLQNGIVAVAAINLSLGLVALFLSRSGTVRKSIWAGSSVFAAGLAVLLVPKDSVLWRPEEVWSKLLFFQEDRMALVKVYEDLAGYKNISINGYVVAGSNLPSQEVQKGLGHLPMLLHENPRTVLIVGFGAGGTSWTVSRYKPERIDCIEFVPSVIKAAPYLREVNHDVLSLPIFHVTIDDGKTFLLTTERKYDVLSIDAIDPKHSGSGSLYAVDFYTLCKKHVNPGGIIVEWLPYHLLSSNEVSTILASFSSVFEHATLWFSRYFNYLLLVGTDHEIAIDYERLESRMSDPSVAADLRELEITDPAEFIYCFAADTAAIKRMTGAVRRLNTYDTPRIEFYTYTNGQLLGHLPFRERSGLPTIKNLGDTVEKVNQNKEKIELHLAVSNHLIRAKQFSHRTEEFRRLLQYKAALSLDPMDPVALTFARATEGFLNQQLSQLLTLAKATGSSEAYCQLSDIYYQQGDLHSAAAALEEALQRNPNSSEVTAKLWYLYEQTGEKKKASELLQSFASLTSTSHR